MEDMNTKQALRRLYAIAKPFWVSEKKYSAIKVLAIVTTFMFASSSMCIFAGYIAGLLTTAMKNQDLHEWFIVVGMCAVVPLVLMATTVSYEFLRSRLAIDWREWYSIYLFKKWYSHNIFLKMRGDKRIDNPEQVMTQEVENLINTVVGLAMTFEAAMVDLVMVMIQLFFIVKILTLSAFAWSVIGSIAVFLIGRPLAKLNVLRSKTDADLRMVLADARKDAESIVMTRGEHQEVDNAIEALTAEMTVQRKMMYVNRNLSMFIIPFNQLTNIMPVLIIAPFYFNTGMEIGVVTTVTIAFAKAVASMTIFVQQFAGISALFSNLIRLGNFTDVLEEYIKAAEKDTADGAKRNKGLVSKSEGLALKNVNLLTPDATRTLGAEISIEIDKGSSWAIIGSNGCGKTTLFRAIADMPVPGNGTISCPARDDMVILPQRPYIADSTLRQALCYPRSVHVATEAQLLSVLKLVGLCDLAQRFGGLDKKVSWRNSLSRGERQRLSLARIFLKPPKYVFLDEATSSMDEAGERSIYLMLKGLGCTLVTVTHRMALLEHHEMVFEFTGGGSWKTYPTKELAPQLNG